MPLPSFITDPTLDLLFFGGKGGVGKTTCACAAALAIARKRSDTTVLLVSTDPAHSVTDALAGHAGGHLPNLQVHELDAAASLEVFKNRHRASLEEISARGTLLDEDDIDALMQVSLPGMDELAAYMDMAAWIEQQRYGCIVVDTAPTGHTLRLLSMPTLVQRWLTALDALLAKHRYMRRRFVHDDSYDHLDRFLLELDRSRAALAKRLADPKRCRFVPVTIPETLSIAETGDLLDALDQYGIRSDEIIANRLLPDTSCISWEGECARQRRALRRLQDLAGDSRRLFGLPLLADEPKGPQLETVWQQASTLTGQGIQSDSDLAPAELPVRVQAPGPVPSRHLRLIMFAGKGGVGKTTLACATAMEIWALHPSRHTLLFSSDPAHSLADCLELPVGAEPRPILAGLDAQEVAAEEAFAEVREQYREELAEFMAERMNHLDLTFDRAAMERLLDLAPPGLDEIMALTTVIDHLDSNRYDTVVLDASPSGHMLRLLELPELIEEWLKLFFRLLLKYRSVMRLPQLSSRLVELSKSVKRLRALLQDPHRTVAQVVTIPTAVAVAETAALIASLNRLGIAVPRLFVNQLTPTGDCSLYQAVHSREAAQLEQLRERLPGIAMTYVFRQAEPTGVAALNALGRELFTLPQIETGRESA